MKKVISLALAAVICSASMLLAACGGSTTKTIATVDDLEGAKIGVQLGTTGDIYASDYEEKGSTVERFNKGADAVLALTQGKIDCVIIDSEPAKAFVAANDGLKILDEPFAAIDAKVRKELRSWLREMIEKLGVTSIFVTHDQDEAIEVADEIMYDEVAYHLIYIYHIFNV